jgi:hypothetical protein
MLYPPTAVSNPFISKSVLPPTAVFTLLILNPCRHKRPFPPITQFAKITRRFT